MREARGRYRSDWFRTQSGNPSSYRAVIEANESGRPAVEKLEPFLPGLLAIVRPMRGNPTESPRLLPR
jgi:hypothetical protein